MTDIPHDVMMLAEEAYQQAIYMTTSDEPQNMVGMVARAIMAEREHAIKIMSDFPEIVHHPAGPAYGAGFSAAVMQMRIAIRRGAI